MQTSEAADSLNGKTVFFVLGVAKSGTTWLQRMLDAHPRVTCSGEDDFQQLGAHVVALMNGYNQESERRNVQQANERYLRFGQQDLPGLMRAVMQYLLAGAAAQAGVDCVGSKFLNFVENAPLFDRALPQARYIHLVRDPRDVIVSTYYFNKQRNPEQLAQVGPTLRAFVDFVIPIHAERLRREIEFIRSAGSRALTLRYCDLLLRPREHLGRAFALLGADTAPELLDRIIEANRFERQSGGRKPGQEDPAAFLRKGVAGDYREKLDEACLEAIRRSPLRDLVAPFGYDLDTIGLDPAGQRKTA